MHTRQLPPRSIVLTLLAFAAVCVPVAAQSFGTDQPTATPPPPMPTDPVQAVEQALALIAEVEDLKTTADDPGRIDKMQRSAAMLDAVLRTLRDEKAPLYIRAKYAEGRHAILSGRPRDAVPGIEQYVNSPIGQNDWYAHKLLGDLRSQNYPQLAKPAYEAAVRLAPNEAEAHGGLALVFLRLARYSDAIESASKAIQLDQEGDPRYRDLLAQAYLKEKKLVEAAAEAKRSVELASARVEREPGNLVALSELQQYRSRVAECYQTLMLVTPEEPSYVVEFVQNWQQLADLRQLLEYHQALRLVEAARKSPMARVSADLLLEEARLNHRVHRDQRAIEILEEILAGTPDHELAREMLNALRGTARQPAAGAFAVPPGAYIPPPVSSPTPAPTPAPTANAVATPPPGDQPDTPTAGVAPAPDQATPSPTDAPDEPDDAPAGTNGEAPAAPPVGTTGEPPSTDTNGAPQ